MKAYVNFKRISLQILSLSLCMLSVLSCKDKNSNLTLVSDTPFERDLIKAPDFKLMSTEDELISLGDYSGRVLVIHIATTWCPYCNAEAPHLEQLYKDYQDKGVGVLIIDVKESKELITDKLVKPHALTFPVVLDTIGAVAASFAPHDVLPELARDEIMLASNIIIDQQGQIQFMSLLDTKNFDSKLIHVKQKLDELLR